MMHLAIHAFVAWLTCFYWFVSLLILVLRINEPCFGNLTRYGGRFEAALMMSGVQSSKTRHPPSFSDSGSILSFRRAVNPRPRQRFLDSIICIVLALSRSALCRLRVSRKRSFCAFYITGITFSLLLLLLPNFGLIPDCLTNSADATLFTPVIGTGGSFSVHLPGWDSSWYSKSLPLIAFLVHCAVRLWECLFLHSFRGGPCDSVTLFAALAGCSFYVFASISSSSFFLFQATRSVLVCQSGNDGQEWLERLPYRSSSPTKSAVVFLLLHLVLQGLQVFHHGILARLRSGSGAWTASSDLTYKKRSPKVTGDVKGAKSTHSDIPYHFPYTHLFTYVLEPHYACEVMMYMVNAVSIWSHIYHDIPPFSRLCEGHMVRGGGAAHCSLLLLLIAVVSYMAPLGVLLFSLFNLSITASEHRRFWIRLNAQQESNEKIPPWNLFYYICRASLAGMPSLGSGYTFEDFLMRLERSPETHMSPLYHQHRELFVRRPDMFSRAVSSITWEKGCALVSAAYHSQPIAVETYRTLLARMLLHNRYVQRSGSGVLVPWMAALRTYSEAILTHGNAVPTQMTISALRLFAPQRQWIAAISLLKLSQANEKMTLPMILEASSCCATPKTWKTAMVLLGLLHAQTGNLLPDCIQSLRPIGTNAATMSAAAHALLPDKKKPTPEQKHVLSVLNEVVAAVPWETALSNEMCVSYLTHLVASTTYTPQKKTEALTSSTRSLPWGVFTQLMIVAQSALTNSGSSDNALPATTLVGPQMMGYHNELEASLLMSSALGENLRLLKGSPEVAVAFIASIVDKMPSAEASASFLREAAALSHGNATAAFHHPLVVQTFLRRCMLSRGGWQLASSVLLSRTSGTLPCDIASMLVLQMREAKQVSLVVDILQRCLVPSKTMLTQKAMEAVLHCVLAQNLAVLRVSCHSRPTARDVKRITSVHWLSALSWATELQQDEIEGRILQTGSAPSAGGVSHTPPVVAPKLKPLSCRMLSLLVHICVSAGSPQGALQAMGYARMANKTELFLSEEIRAVLYCMLYDRPYEAEAIVRQVGTKYGKDKAQYLERLLQIVEERKECESTTMDH